MSSDFHGGSSSAAIFKNVMIDISVQFEGNVIQNSMRLKIRFGTVEWSHHYPMDIEGTKP